LNYSMDIHTLCCETVSMLVRVWVGIPI